MIKAEGSRAGIAVAMLASLAVSFAAATPGKAQGGPQSGAQGQTGEALSQGQTGEAPPLRQTAQPFGQGQPFGQAQPLGQGQPFGQPQRQVPSGQGQPQMSAPQQGAQGGGAGCDKLTVLLTERKNLVAALSSAAKTKSMDASTACGHFTKLIKNGEETVKWMAANQAWCRIPEQFIVSLRADNEKAGGIRGQACKAAAQIEAAKKNPQNRMFGGNGLTGEMKIPSGAL